MDSIVRLYTDGACSMNPGPGGWCAILKYREHEKVLCGGEKSTTNNRMELTAVIEGLKALKRRCAVEIYTDSKYVADAITKGWAESWRKKGWKKGDNSPALNPDLWEQLLNLIAQHDVKIIWLRGHAGHPENERCDKIAVEQSKKYAK
ncbi:MAG TPA: ribonuclease HI [Clostridiales bacterium]|nr:ribonuclease HI [Clostridiales bacterium]HPU66688.1 ribonuclease HI [Clostridiales bacterium]HQD73294.1 ribonuclease HI [Clostridiales bacterium]HXK84013.1 ribonuclease HI [Clostridiales bacterium]